MKPTLVMSDVEITNPNFRPKTKTHMRDFVFDMKMPGAKTAALGDMIAWMSAIVYVAENYNFVAGHLIVPQFFLELAANVMRPYAHWRVYNAIPERFATGCPLKRPLEHPLNATGMHLVDLGYVYFAGLNPVPEGAGLYPELDLSKVKPEPAFSVGGPYAVMTPGATAKTRTMPAETFNAITDHLLEKNIIPVYLGAKSLADREEIIFNADYDLSEGVNLIGKTTLLQAARLMAGAEMVIGIDNGLLHLAGMTRATILFGYTMVGPRHRRINRAHGNLIELYGDKEKIPCLFCQEHVRFFVDHHFTNCIYKENVPACVKALNTESWKATIDVVLKEQDAARG